MIMSDKEQPKLRGIVPRDSTATDKVINRGTNKDTTAANERNNAPSIDTTERARLVPVPPTNPPQPPQKDGQ
jgi:hypothetical protein